MKILKLILFVTALFIVDCAKAQDDDEYYYYYDDYSYDDYSYDSYNYGDTYQQPCEHSGRMEIFQITRYRAGMSIYDETYNLPGKIRISESCIEIDCAQFFLYFCVGERTKVNDKYYKFRRCSYDEHYDYIELRSMSLSNPKSFTMFVGRIDDDGNMHDTVMFNCTKIKVEYPTKKLKTK